VHSVAIGSRKLYFYAMTSVTLKKFDEELQIVYGEVYVPNVPDTDGDFMTVDGVRKMAYEFLASMFDAQQAKPVVDTNHNHIDTNSCVVESFVARKGDPDFIEDSWVVGVHIPDEDIWDQAKKGELNGFSFEGLVKRTTRVIEIEIPELIAGHTQVADGHKHTFYVRFDELGEFLGGHTSESDGHSHQITRGTITDIMHDHTHRYSINEGIISG